MSPGTQLLFYPSISIIVLGDLIAQGTADNRITLTALNSSQQWGQIYFPYDFPGSTLSSDGEYISGIYNALQF